MKLKELKTKIDEMYNKYGNVDVCVNLSKNDEDIQISDDSVYTDNVQDITETTDLEGNVNGICISNYIVESED